MARATRWLPMQRTVSPSQGKLMMERHFLPRSLANSSSGHQPCPRLRGSTGIKEHQHQSWLPHSDRRETRGGPDARRCSHRTCALARGRWRGRDRVKQLWPRSTNGMNLCSQERTCHKHRPSRVTAGQRLSCVGRETKYEAQNPWKDKRRCRAIFECGGERAHFRLVGLNQSTKCPQVKNRDTPQGHWKLKAPNRRKGLSTNPMKPSGPLCSFIHHVMHTSRELPEMQMGRKMKLIIQKKITQDSNKYDHLVKTHREKEGQKWMQ